VSEPARIPSLRVKELTAVAKDHQLKQKFARSRNVKLMEDSHNGESSRSAPEHVVVVSRSDNVIVETLSPRTVELTARDLKSKRNHA